MEFGLGMLMLPPAAFWALTPKELDSILRGRCGRGAVCAGPTRSELDDLMCLFPDEG
jgi:uncharacterized phage protein (TIGR02216 family)